MQTILTVHIAAGVLGLLAGTVALSARKGLTPHRKSGTVFVYAMLAMAASGAFMAVLKPAMPQINLPASALAAYLVVSAVTTVQPPSPAMRRVETATLFAGLAIGLACFGIALPALTGWTGKPNIGLAIPLLIFGSIALLGARADWRMLRTQRPQGPARLRRHLWRMCTALLIAALSFFIGQAKVFPDAIRESGLLPLPVLAVLLVMLYWLWRVRRA